MVEIWVVAEQQESMPTHICWELVTHGRGIADKLNGRLIAVIMGWDLSAVGERLRHGGVDEVYLLESQKLREHSCERYAQALSSLIRERAPEVVLWGATVNGSDLAARVAARLAVGLVPGCVGFDVNDEGLLLQIRPVYGGRAYSTVVSRGAKPQAATVRPSSVEVRTATSSVRAKVTKVSTQVDPGRCRVETVGLMRGDPLTVGIEEAEIIVAGGRGVGSSENFKLLEDLAKSIGGTLAGSRIAVDRRWISRERQVGQTGKTVKPKLYVACGVSGSAHHTLGMKDSETTIAINTDPDAPIFNLADMGVVGDLLEVLPAITVEVERRRGGKGSQ